MENEKLKIEIDRLRNFRSGLKKQVEHYDKLLREMLTEYALNNAKYEVGSIITYYNSYTYTGVVKSVTADFFGEDKIAIKYTVKRLTENRTDEFYEGAVKEFIGKELSTSQPDPPNEL